MAQWSKICLPIQETQFDLWVRKIPREGNGNPLQSSYLGNGMDRGAWWATVQGVAESDRFSMHSHSISFKCSLPFPAFGLLPTSMPFSLSLC